MPSNGEVLLTLWLSQLNSIPDSHEMFNEQEAPTQKSYRLAKNAKSSSTVSGRKSCWVNVLENISKNISSTKYTYNHCILSTSALQKRGGTKRSSTKAENGYVHVAFGSTVSTTGTKSQKHRPLHCILWLLFHPDDIKQLESNKNSYHVSHYCHTTNCTNTWDHLGLLPEAYNQSQNGCKHGSQLSCPHRPIRCIYTDIKGIPIPCLNNISTINASCQHKPNCWKTRRFSYKQVETIELSYYENKIQRIH